ncbi:right-handed parallel beta-helix repeat-containing protein [Catenulispora sp. NL8]|uniref:Right-handed parallel beta-helix repeat-containing protein n=1 Tax=Catenulispora pinistramenti TaxID=2705254 RepID=A0ABS5L2Q0_9ACTN|nr:right-handed parallel beta-helix repeat-containing protein [Catenulispora pinistramenti]MBS2552598.1 right-handed parallel beta-helix repeat-containing protein [Catenulispora pinistramenti]
MKAHLRASLSALSALGALSLGAVGLLAVTVPTAHAAGTGYYVDCSAASDGDGSAGTPWNALSDPDGHVFTAGDTLSFKAGTTCDGTLTPQGSGASGSPIVINAYGSGAAPVIEGGGATEATVHLVDQSYWTISGLKVQNSSFTRAQHEGILVEVAGTANQAGISITGNEVANVAGWGDKTGTNASWFSYSGGIAVRVASGSGVFNGVSVTDNNVHDTGGGGIKVEGEASAMNTGVYIGHNTITAAGGDGIVVHDSDSPLVEYNTATDLGLGAYPFTAGNFAGMWPYHSNNPTFQYNTVGSQTGVVNDATAWDCDMNNTGTCLFQYNYSYNNAGGFYLDCLSGCGGSATTTNAVLRYNISRDDCRFTNSSTGTGTHYIYNNTFFCPGKPITDTLGGNVVWQDNIFVAPTAAWASDSSATFDSNTYFGGVSAPSSGDAGAHTADPQLTNDAAGTLAIKLRTASPEIGSGAVVANNGGKDFFGNAVSATAAPNRGAYNGSGDDSVLSFAAALNDTAVTSDADRWAGSLNSATQSGKSFSATALANAGLTAGADVTAAGIDFGPWHPQALDATDNVLATGQTIAVTGSGTKVGFLGFSTTHGVTENGTLNFTDGTSQAFTLTLSDWTDTTPATGDTLVATATYANQHTSAYNGSTTTASGSYSVWADTVALPAGKTLASVTLPNLVASSATSQHLFGIALG